MRRSLIAPAALVAALATAGLARACALDNVPSLTADGQLDRLMDTPITSAQLAVATFSPFILPRSFAAGHTITFTEIRKEVARSLLPDAMQRPWRWQFGDGGAASGWTVKHAYAHPGAYRIVVEAYAPATKQWYAFDKVTITIAPAPRAKHR